MKPSIRRLVHVAPLVAVATLSAADSAALRATLEPTDPVEETLVATRGDLAEPDGTLLESSGEPTPFWSDLLGAAIATAEFVAAQCFEVTPVVYETSVSVPPAGSGHPCTHDEQCSSASEFCAFPRGSIAGTCQSSGHLARGDIHYVAGGVVDVDVTIPDCTFVSDVLLNGASIGASGGFETSGAGSFTVVSTAATTVGGQPAVRHQVRVQFPHFGFGDSFSLAVVATANVGGATATSAAFTVADVDAVNAAMHNSVAETRVRNGFVTSLYEKFGDYDQVWVDGEVKAYDLDWSELAGPGSPVPLGYADASDIRIGTDSVVFSMHFQAPGCGDVDVNGIGWFDLVPFGDGLDLVWVEGPRVGTDGGAVCNALQLVWEAVAGDVFDEAALADEIGSSVESGFQVDDDNHLTVCPSCRIIDVAMGAGAIDIYSVPPGDRVRVRVSTTRRTDPTADPMAQGLVLPAGMYAPIAAGGIYRTCQTSDGQSPATCAPQFAVDMDGLFNWWGDDVPVPSPIAYDAQGHAFLLDGRQAAWERLEGVVRDVTKLPEPSFPVGSLIARRSATDVEVPTRALVSNGCLMPPVADAPYRVAFGVNDIATPATGDPPTSGELEVTVVLLDDVSQSQELFAGREPCQPAPSRPWTRWDSTFEEVLVLEP